MILEITNNQSTDYMLYAPWSVIVGTNLQIDPLSHLHAAEGNHNPIGSAMIYPSQVVVADQPSYQTWLVGGF